MSNFRLLVSIIITCCFRIYVGKVSKTVEHTNGIPIVFVFTMLHCDDVFPHYISFSVEQALITQPEFPVIMLGNFRQCPNMKLKIPAGVIIEDIDTLKTKRTNEFHNLSLSIFSFAKDALWITAARRFFYLEDLMNTRGYNELIHVEGDNLIYGNFSRLVNILRDKNYKYLAATPSTGALTTASVFWVGQKEAITHFNDYLLSLMRNNTGNWTAYINYLRKYGYSKSAKDGGLYPNARGTGVRPVREIFICSRLYD